MIPTAELVTKAWLKSIPALAGVGVATLLPADQSTWAEKGFITLSVVGGTPHVYTPMHHPVMQIDCWGNRPASIRPPWALAGQIAAVVHEAADDFGIPTSLTVGDGYDPVQLHTAHAVSEARRVPSDGAGFARYMLDVQINWTKR